MLNNTLLKVTSLLKNHGIPYMIIGGYAVLYHGEARFTEDIDIVIGVDTDELEKIIGIIESDFKVRTEKVEEFVSQTNVLPLKEIESGIKVDIIFSFIEFEREAIRNAEVAKIEKAEVRIVSVNDLVIYKLLAGRAKDIDDAKSIIQINNTKIDKGRIDRVVEEMTFMLDNDSIAQKWNAIKDQ